MIRPSKHSHPDRTVVYLATLLVKRLRRLGVDSYSDLFSYATGKVDGGEALFVPALQFLYLLGLVDYQKKSDSFEYVGPRA